MDDFEIKGLIEALAMKRLGLGIRMYYHDEQIAYDNEKDCLWNEYRSAEDKKNIVNKWEEELRH